ncbi:nitroreductase family protein [Macrococcus hajekii]|uniref:Nitroreductase family protein n=1 Tax=Macrococcus hajekii TaxID=198482 RepID=A0A4V6PPP5_9STAP|nr:nitroreductase family protein [Macrococcus hajekii]TDM02565.1 nitroreductase family protein [Macrococcus hajekii]GGB02009.1 putative NAD(P)H nitroreductase YodC [Macrococcus hajekii]
MTEFNIFTDRKAVKEYDASYQLSKEALIDLLEKANRAPSAWNLQHWKYIVVHSDQMKERLLPLAFNQKQIVDASATVIVLADKEAERNIDAVFNPDVEAGRMPAELKERLAGQINGAHSNPEYAFEAGVLNASLAAMQFMNAATLAGLSTCPIGGFNRTELIETFNIEDRYLPIMLIPVGKSAKEPRSTSRLSVEETATFL